MQLTQGAHIKTVAEQALSKRSRIHHSDQVSFNSLYFDSH